MLEVLGNTEFTFQMWSLFTLIVVALIFYANENVPMEVTSVATLVLLLLFFHFFPILDQNDNNLLGADRLLHGFANTALLTVLALLVVGQGMARTGVLEIVARYILWISFGKLWLAVLIALLAVLFISAFLNNIPVVVIFIPILQGIAQRFKQSFCKLMMFD
jgi:Na+/H+ antiporter NhaD/arsenite permease-like protein